MDAIVSLRVIRICDIYCFIFFSKISRLLPFIVVIIASTLLYEFKAHYEMGNGSGIIIYLNSFSI